MKIFEYAIVFHPTKKARKEDDAKSEILGKVTSVLARDESHAALLAARDIPELYADKLDQVS